MNYTKRLTEYGPLALIPAAWITVIATINGSVGTDPLMIAHGVMIAFLIFFTYVGWSKMTDKVLSVWRLVIAGGIPVTIAGLVGFWIDHHLLLTLSLVYWAILPGIALIETGIRMPDHRIMFVLAGTVTLLGVVLAKICQPCATGGSMTVGLAVVGIGQFAGIGYTAMIRDDPLPETSDE